MDLFADGSGENLLPYDGEVVYLGPVFSAAQRRRLMADLLSEVPWAQDEVMMFGKLIRTARKVAWFADGGRSYRYSGRERLGLDWVDAVLGVRERVEELAGVEFDSCLANWYADGEQGMGWHRDDEAILERDACIASVSFGARRRFDFRHVGTREKVHVWLEDGSVLLMRGSTQRFWQHQMPKSKKVKGERVNLTFRRLVAV